MKGINKAIIVGTLGGDPVIRYTQSGSAVATLSIATNESWNDKATGQKQEKTEWHRVVIFGNLAEIAGKYLTKGGQVYIEGKLQTRKWNDRNTGMDRFTTEIVLDPINGVLQMLGNRPNTGGNHGMEHQPGQGQQPPQFGQQGQPVAAQGGQANNAGQQPANQGQQMSAPAPAYTPNDFDDDVLFSLKATWPELIAYV